MAVSACPVQFPTVLCQQRHNEALPNKRLLQTPRLLTNGERRAVRRTRLSGDRP